MQISSQQVGIRTGTDPGHLVLSKAYPNPGSQSSRKHESANLSTELGLKSVTTTTTTKPAGRSTYWDGPRTSSSGQSLANPGCLKSVTTTTTIGV